MGKEVSAVIKLQIEGGKANPAPPVGSALGSRQVNIMDFCKKFNEVTKGDMGVPLPVKITVFKDKTFDFKVGKPSMSYYIKVLAGVQSCSKTPGRNGDIAVIKKADAIEFIKQKMSDLNCHGDIDAAMSMFKGSARSAGVRVED